MKTRLTEAQRDALLRRMIKEEVAAVPNLTKEQRKQLEEQLWSKIKGAVGGAAKVAQKVGGAASGAVSGAVGQVQKAGQAVGQAVGGAVDKAKKALSDKAANVQAAIGDVGKALQKAYQEGNLEVMDAEIAKLEKQLQQLKTDANTMRANLGQTAKLEEDLSAVIAESVIRRLKNKHN